MAHCWAISGVGESAFCWFRYLLTSRTISTTGTDAKLQEKMNTLLSTLYLVTSGAGKSRLNPFSGFLGAVKIRSLLKLKRKVLCKISKEISLGENKFLGHSKITYFFWKFFFYTILRDKNRLCSTVIYILSNWHPVVVEFGYATHDV